MRYVDCSKKGGYDPKDKCKQTCLADSQKEHKAKPKPIMCIKRYVDCSRRGGYNPKDKCRQTCMKKTANKYIAPVPKQLLRPDVVQVPELELKRMEGEVAAFFKMGAAGQKAWWGFIRK